MTVRKFNFRDRMLAIEAQDKELAKVLQEKERNRARRARERAKQKSLAKKQIEQQQQTSNTNQVIMPDDSYSYPADLIPPRNSIPKVAPSDTYALPTEDDVNYSLPADVLHPGSPRGSSIVTYSPQKGYEQRYGDGKIINSVETCREGENGAPVRPNQLDLK